MASLSKKNSSSPFLKQDGAATKSNAIDIPSITLPKGGGALKGIDEKFSVNAVSGTGSFSIPLPVSPSRGGFQPSLSLSYNSGGGNSIFGIGWGVGFPTIQRKTDKKLPTYQDRDDGDVFLFSGAEDLVPITQHSTTLGNFEIKLYRPRIEGLFARIEKVIPSNNKKKFYWKVTTKENVVTFFGMSDACRIADPQNDTRIYQWLPEISFDDKGNCIRFIYKQEDKMNIPASLNEQYRIDGTAPFTNKYLKRVKYGNKGPFYPGYVADPSNVNALYDNPTLPTEFMFELVFDYGEHTDDSGVETTFWTARKDAFSNYKPGFEIRTYRLCKRVMVFHHFNELNSGIQTLVRSLDMRYDQPEDPQLPVEVTYLTEIRQKGYTKKAGVGYFESLPLLSFEYQRLKWDKKIHHVDKEDLAHAPAGLSGNYHWTDFYNEGLPGILTEQANAWYYKSNLGQAHFSHAQLVSPKPSFTGIQTGALQLMDLDANGTKQVVSYQPGLNGYFELTDDNDWLPFRAFEQMPSIDMKDANTRLIDLNGDGKPELVITEEYAFRWYPSNGTAGYDSPEMAPKSFDEEKGPAIVFADSTQSIYLADMSGDGLADIVRIDHHGSVCYWPNKGYGQFGAKVNMGSIQITDPFSFNHGYLQLADVSGTGSTDIIYLGNNKWQVWINKSGNCFSAPCEIDPFWQTTKPGQINIVDLLGNGTSCIVWSSPLPGDGHAPMQYIDLMGGKKPHIMVAYKNGMGKTTTVEYKSSTQYYLDDKKAGTPWITHLPFPVHCIGRIEVVDEVTDLRFVTKYNYHHGYYDHEEREFRGFGRVDQIDTEEYEYLKNSGASNATSIEFHEPPLITRTWNHTGAFIRNKKILNQFETEYWYHDPSFANGNIQEHTLNDAQLPAGLTLPETLEAYRACKGMVLRTEVFSLDGSAKEKIPYSVVTHNCIIQMLQAKASNPHAVFLVQESESITFSYERKVSDPRIAHSLNLEIDQFGNVLKSVLVVYGRNPGEADASINDLEIIKQFTDPVKKQRHTTFLKEAQTKQHIIFTETKVTSDGEEMINGKKLKYYRLPQPWSVKNFEVSTVSRLNPYFRLSDFAPILSGNVAIKAYHETFDQHSAQIQFRLIEHIQTLLLSSDLENPLPAGHHGAMGISYESYQLAFTPALVDALFNVDLQGTLINPKRVTDIEIADAKYCHVDHDLTDVNWWIRSGKIKYYDATKNETRVSSQNRYYVPIMYTDPFGSTTQAEYPANDSFLFVKKIIDASGNESGIVDFDYRVLAASKMHDMNDNLSEVAFNALGLVVGMAVMGKGNQADDLSAFTSDLNETEVGTFFADPYSKGKDLLKNATARLVYDFKSIPAKVATIIRETHVRNENATPNPESKLQYSFEYTGGMGNSVLKKVRAENGKAKKVENRIVIEVDADPRWIGNGRTILNNKGNPVKQYEPYFSTTHLYESEPALREFGVTPVLHYDPAGRMVRTDYPDRTFSRVEFDGWQQSTFDQNDTIKKSKWAALRGQVNDFTITSDVAIAFLAKLQVLGRDIAQERAALAKSLIHADTPSVVLTDSLGRPYYTIDHNAWKFTNVTGPQPSPVVEYSATRLVLDIEGNTRAVIDARDNTVMQYEFDMLGHTMHSVSMDAGERWLLKNSLGKPARAWDERNHTFRRYYDALHRPLYSHVVGGDGTTSLDHVFDRLVYGESEVNAKAKNVRGKPIQHYDTGGVVETHEYDFKGQPKSTTRKLFAKYKEVTNWVGNNLLNDLEADAFIFKTETDALGRITTQTTPDGSIIKPTYNAAGLLNGESVEHFNPTALNEYITDINYNEKGQRNFIKYGNGVRTTFEYDNETFRLAHLKSNHNTKVLQDLHYTYDPVGNITFIKDDAHDPEFFSNQIIEPLSSYTYDALYRIKEATGRENSAALTFGNNDNWSDTPFMQENPMAVKKYTQRYQYDVVGNMEEMDHDAAGNMWKREYKYEQTNNRLKTTRIGLQQYSYPHHPKHGFITQMPHLQKMGWNFKEELMKAAKQKINPGNGTAQTTYFQYDGQGQRIRKITENSAQAGAALTRKDERIYISGYETYKAYQSNAINFERISLSLMDAGHRFVMVETVKQNTRLNPAPSETVGARLVRYQLHNHLGSSALELDNNAAVISYEEYHPYGTTAYQSKNKLIKCASKRYRYTGMERDEETGLEYHSARYYLPWLGRWLNGDPIGIKGSLNVYVYAKSNPIEFVDPNGKADYGWQKGASFLSVPNSRFTGTLAHADSLPVIEARINQSDFFEAQIEFQTRPGGATFGRSKWSVGRVDLGVFGSTQGRHIFDLKPSGGTQRALPQVRKYALFDASGVSAKPGARLLSEYTPAALDPVHANGRGYLLSQSGASPETIRYHAFDVDSPQSSPTVEYKPALTNPPVEPGASAPTATNNSPVGKTAPPAATPNPKGQKGSSGPTGGRTTVGGMMTIAGLSMTAIALIQTKIAFDQAYKESVKQDSQKPLEDEAIRQAGSWGLGIAGGVVFGIAVKAALGGAVVGGPAGMALGFFGGLAVGAAASWLGGQVAQAGIDSGAVDNARWIFK